MTRRVLDWLTLAAGLTFALSALWSVPITWPLFALLPDQPDQFIAAFDRTTGALRGFHRGLGVVIFLLVLLDSAGHASLGAPRVRWRGVEMLALLALALFGVLWLEPSFHAAGTGSVSVASLKLGLLFQVALFVLVGVASVAAYRSPHPPPIVKGERYAARWIPPIFGTTPELPQRQWQVLGLMIAATFFNAYDISVFGLALKQIQAGLQIEEGQLGFLGSAIGLGVVPGVLLALAADTLGRRQVLLVTIAGYTVFTGLTALSPNDWIFLVCQFCAKAFGTAEMVLAMVVVAEEIESKHRGWALGVLGALAFMGAGLALMMFAFVERLPMGWRAMYLVGFFPLLVIMWFRRRLPETGLFQRYDATRRDRTLASSLRPLVSLVRVYPGRFAAIGSTRFLNAFSTQAAHLFLPKYLQEEHGWNPEEFAIVGAVLGLASLCGMPLLGRLGDRIGRKTVSVVVMILAPLSVIGLYSVMGPFAIALTWLAMSLSDGIADMNVSVFSKELFPTSYRSTASSARQLIGQLGGSLGMAMESVLFTIVGSHALAISIVALPGLAMPLIVAFAIPETSGRALDEISPEIGDSHGSIGTSEG